MTLLSNSPRLWRWILCLAALPLLVSAEQLRVEEEPITDADRDHWSFCPLSRPALPDNADAPRVRNEIDQFIAARLEPLGLSFQPDAEPETILRRVTFDLTGLPPDPDRVLEFLEDPSDENYAAYVQSLLRSPAYGERWAQHWLDLVRFAESDGFEHDQTRPDAWRYRDWVIDALNLDMSYDRFVKLQLAGDELEPENENSKLATGFLLAGPDMPDINSQEERRHNVLNDITSTVGTTLLGLTMNCAQCHDHPYDPVSHADFYRLRAFFDNAVYPAGGKQLGHIVSEPNPRPPRHFVYNRGDYRDRGPEIAPWFLRIVNPEHEPVPSLLETIQPHSSGRRMAFAEWLAREDNQLFLRSSVNRLWLHHFGKPLAGTPNDLGVRGKQPAMPELLDWLATELPRRQWSLKEMHKLMVTSTTYRQTSQPVDLGKWAAANFADPENQFFSRMNRTRLSGEAIRDAMLDSCGMLNRKAGGPSVNLPLPAEVELTLLKKQRQVTEDVSEHHRRSIYVFSRRNLGYPMFDVFDRPDRLTSCAQRTQSTTPTQSLTVMNSPFSREMADAMAQTILETAGDVPSNWVDAAALHIYSRPASDDERSVARHWLQQRLFEGDEPRAVLSDYCLALYNTNAFFYVD